MMLKNVLLLMLFVLIAVASSCTRPQVPAAAASNAKNQERWLSAPTVILISIDGLRHDYIARHQPPTLTRLQNEGASAKGLTPIFPSKTFPNHMSIITGVKAGKHGIVGNEFFEPSSGRHYAMKKRQEVEDGYWYQAPPVWNMLKAAGMVTASYFWVGSEAKIQGQQPDYWYPYDSKVAGEERVDQVLRWLNMEEIKRPHFITLYFSDVDNAGHEFGPDAPELKESLLAVDGHLARLTSGLSKLKFPVHVVVVSDHGMGALSENKIEFIEEFWQAGDGDQVLGQGANVSIYLKDQTEANQQAVVAALNKNSDWRAYRRRDFPASWGLDHERIGDILVVGKPGHYLYEHKKSHKGKMQGGSHGWDAAKMTDMDGVFIAHGPQIVAKKKLGRVLNVNVAPFLLGLFGEKTPAHMDGRWSELGAHIWRR